MWTNLALSDLKAIKQFIARDSLFYSNQVILRIVKSIEKLHLFPKLGKKVSELDNELIREITMNPYRIIYKYQDDTIIILTIVHGKQNY